MEQRMERDVLQKLKRQKHRRFWSKLVSVMMCIVVFCTTYALILPAITLETDTFCGKEAHTHTVDCYPTHGDLICTIEAHIHTDACNSVTETALVCELQEVQGHSHTESCNITQEKTLLCQIPESPGHAHSEECQKTEEKNLICQAPESAGHTHTTECSITEQLLTCLLEETEGHSHGEGCFADTLTCTLSEDETHTHETACYTQQLICTLAEAPAHTHGEGCYHETVTNICGQEVCEAHTHTDDCYSITVHYGCGLKESEAHAHTDACYTTTTSYGCGLEEAEPHAHDDACYEPAHTCPLTETEGHAHSDACYRTVYDCGLEEQEHVHAEECYAPSPALICTLEENDAHTHTAECYTGSPTCELEEHEHTLQCFSDPYADLETASVWKNTLPPLTGQYAEDVLAIARSQLGYTESSKNYLVADSGVVRGYTRYGAWYGYPYGDWCAMFVSFCLHYAEVEDIPLDCACDNWVDALIRQDMYAPAADYIPLPGDLIFFDWNEDSSADHVGLVAQYFPEDENSVARVQTIEGNSDNTVRYTSYNQADPYILGYGILPEQPEETTSPDETVIPSETAVLDDTEGTEEAEVPGDTEVPNETEGYEVITKQAVIYTDSTYAVPASDATVITISGAIPPDVEIKAFPVTLADAQVVCAYDIAMFLPDGTVYEPTELVTVSIQPPSIPQEDLEVYYHPDQGQPQKMDSTVTDDGVIFDTNHFSTYAVWAMGDKYDLQTYVESVSIEYKAAGETTWMPLEGNTVNVNDALRFTLDYLVPGKTLSQENPTLTYQLPFNVTSPESGLVQNKQGNFVGNYSITADGLITITFDPEYAEENAGGKDISGYISFVTTVKELDNDSDGQIDIPFKDEIHLDVEGIVQNTEDLQVTKTSSNHKPTEGTVDYTIEVTSQNGTSAPIILNDVMTNINASGKITVQKGGTDITDSVSIDRQGRTFSVELPALGAGEKYTITYSAKIPSAESLNDALTATNKVTVESKDSNNGTLKDEAEVENPFERNVLKKTGAIDGDHINWTITVNTSKVDIGGWELSDLLNNAAYTGTVTITPNPATGGDSTTVELPYTFPSGSKQTYTVTYSTPRDSNALGNTTYSNTAVLVPDDGGRIESGTGVSENNYNPLTKQGVGVALAGQLADGNYLAEYKWTTTISASEGDIIPYSQTYDHTTYNAWVYSDELWQEEIHWMTGTQLIDLKQSLEANYSGRFTIVGYLWTGHNPKYQTAVPFDEIQPADKFGQFRIFFHDTLEMGSTIQFSYSSTVNVGDGSASQSITNRADINGTAEDRDSQSYKPLVEKKDKKGGGSTTEHAITDLTQQGVERVLGWNVKVTIPENMVFEEDLIITEQIPPGTQLLAPDAPDWALSFGMSGGSFNNLAEHEFDFSKGNEASLTYTVRSTDYTITAKYVAGAYVITVPKDLANIRRGSTITIQVRVQINEDFDWDTAYKSFVNRVIVSEGSNPIGSASQEQIIHNPLLSKASGTVSNNIIPYTLQINPNGKDLVANSDTLTLTDVLEYTNPTNGVVTANLLTSMVKVYQVTPEGNVDITQNCPFTFSETTADGKQQKIIVMTIPDGVPLLVEYRYMVVGTTGISTNLHNTAKIEGQGHNLDQGVADITVQVDKSNAGATILGVSVYKVDAENYNIKLDGCKFDLQMWNGQDYETINSFVTDTYGSFSTGALTKYLAYRLVEVESPHGYILDPAPYYFYITDESGGTLNAPEGFTGDALIDNYDIYVPNEKQPYLLPETGGTGTIPYTMAGLLLMMSSAAYLMYRPKARRREEG